MIYMFLSNNPSPGDINSSNLSCLPSESVGYSILSYIICNGGVGTASERRSCKFVSWQYVNDVTQT